MILVVVSEISKREREHIQRKKRAKGEHRNNNIRDSRKEAARKKTGKQTKRTEVKN